MYDLRSLSELGFRRKHRRPLLPRSEAYLSANLEDHWNTSTDYHPLSPAKDISTPPSRYRYDAVVLCDQTRSFVGSVEYVM